MANIIGDDFSNKDGGSVEIYAEHRRKPDPFTTGWERTVNGS